MMIQYEYHAIDLKGNKTKGEFFAQDEQKAKQALLEKDLVLIKLKIKKHGKNLRLNTDSKLQWAKLFLQLLHAGFPVFESLQMLKEQCNKTQKLLQEELIEHLKNGNLLSYAMQQFPKCFDLLLVSMVKASESSGKIEQAFKTYIEMEEKRQVVKKKLIGALMYPGVVLTFSLSALFLLLVIAVPALKELIQIEQLNILSKSIFMLSDFLLEQYHYLLFSISLSILFAFLMVKRRGIYFFLFKVPIIKTILYQKDLFYFSQSLSHLLKSHVPLFESMQLSRGLLKHRGLKKLFLNAEMEMTEGKQMSSILQNDPKLPKMIIQMLKIGEESASIHLSFENIAHYFEEKVDKKVTKFLTLLQPLILILLGLFVGLIMLALLVPLTNADYLAF
jgi:general secretion pathway protein F/type IV pilus assembly protein PilC